MDVARRSRHIAVQSATVGMGLSLLAMTEHDQLRDTLGLLRDAADVLVEDPDGDRALPALRTVHAFLTDRLLPHEHREESQLYPALAGPLGGSEATATMSRTHTEIDRLATRIGTHLAVAEPAGHVGAGQVHDLLACLYGLDAVLRLHFLLEEENYFVLTDRTDA